jgi:hypothetical protein
MAMKTKTLYVALIYCALASANATDLQPYPGELRGRIMQVVAGGGMLVDGAFKTDETDATRRPIIVSGTFFLRGFKGNAVDGDNIDVKALPDGTYSYTTVRDAIATVRALRFVDE